MGDSINESEHAVPVLEGERDNFNGIIVKPKHYGAINVDEFRQRLARSLSAWKSEGRRGVWVKILLSQAELVPVAAKLGFQFHHTHPEYVMMTHWLPDNEESTIPYYATHNVGVAGFVVNDKNELLLVQEKWLRSLKIRHWKLPGGVADPGENLWQTAIRETEEETGIRTEFVSMLSFRHMHGYRWGTSDLYFAALLRPLNNDITINPSEIADATWMNVDEYLADPNTFPTNRMIAQAYKDGVERGVFVQPHVYPHFLPNRKDQVMYFIQRSDLAPYDPTTKSHDQTTKSHDKVDDSSSESNIKPAQTKSNI